MDGLKAIIFWSIMTVPLAILYALFPWLLIVHVLLGALAAYMYAEDFGSEKELNGMFAAFVLPHIYFLIKIIFRDGGIL
jgi:hypothetical protein